jgi:hypothetical protein
MITWVRLGKVGAGHASKGRAANDYYILMSMYNLDIDIWTFDKNIEPKFCHLEDHYPKHNILILLLHICTYK